MKTVCRLLSVVILVGAVLALLCGAGYVLGPEDGKPAIGMALFGLWTLGTLYWGIRLGKHGGRMASPYTPSPLPQIPNVEHLANYLRTGGVVDSDDKPAAVDTEAVDQSARFHL